MLFGVHKNTYYLTIKMIDDNDIIQHDISTQQPPIIIRQNGRREQTYNIVIFLIDIINTASFNNRFLLDDAFSNEDEM